MSMSCCLRTGEVEYKREVILPITKPNYIVYILVTFLLTFDKSMMSRVTYFLNIFKRIERSIFHAFGGPPKEFALAYVNDIPPEKVNSKFSIKDIVGDGFLLAVPKFRRTVEKRLKRKFGNENYVWHMIKPQTNIKVCYECGHHHERGRLCTNCYKRVEKETKEIQAKIEQELGYCKPIEHDVIVLYEGEKLPDEPKEFWEGKRIIEMKKERPQWFSKNLLQKSTQQPSTSTDVKPTDLA